MRWMKTEPGQVFQVDLGIAGKLRYFVVVSRDDSDPPRALALCVPITTQNRGSAYEVELPRVGSCENKAMRMYRACRQFSIMNCAAPWDDFRLRPRTPSKMP